MVIDVISLFPRRNFWHSLSARDLRKFYSSKKGLSFISNRQRRKEGTFCASGLAGIEPTPPAPVEQGMRPSPTTAANPVGTLRLGPGMNLRATGVPAWGCQPLGTGPKSASPSRTRATCVVRLRLRLGLGAGPCSLTRPGRTRTQSPRAPAAGGRAVTVAQHGQSWSDLPVPVTWTPESGPS